MKLIYQLLHLDPDSREDTIAAASVVSLLVNLFVAAAKIAVGLSASSIAIISEGANNAADALTSVLTLIGARLAGKHPDAKHPFGYGRIEYLTSLIVSVLILTTGFEMLTGAIKLIIHPEELNITGLTIIIVSVSAVIKYFLGAFTIRAGRQTGSSALEAVGIESRNDSFVSIVTVVSSVVFLVFHISIDAYVGLLTSLLILKSGLSVLISTISELIGRPGDDELAEKLYREIRGTEGVLGAADMMLHNYGPGAWSGSVNIEIDHKKTIGEIYQNLHSLQLRIMQEYHSTMVFGIYAVDNDNEEIKEIREWIAAFIRDHEHIKSYHALYLEPQTGKIYCDMVVDYEQKDWGALRIEFVEYMGKYRPENEIELVIETEYV